MRENRSARGKAFLILLAVLAAAACAQDGGDAGQRRIPIPPAPSDSLARNVTSIGFDRSLNTYHWTATTIDTIRSGPYQVSLNEQFLSTLIRSSQILINDNQALTLRLRRSLDDRL